MVPIIILCATRPTKNVAGLIGLEDDEGIGCFVGSANWAPDLIRSGVQECSVIVSLGQGSAGDADFGRELIVLLDSDVVMLQRMLDRIGVMNKAMLFEFKRTQNMHVARIEKCRGEIQCIIGPSK